MIRSERDGDGILSLTWDLPDRPVNVLNPALRAAFIAAVDAALADDTVRGILITSAKRDFVAGADLTVLRGFRGAPAGELMRWVSPFRDALRRLERGGKPVVAALNGTALGGGLEIALACHRRIAADLPGAEFGLPEATLGLLPGAGGTQRLPRLIGVKAALPLMLEGRRLSAEAARGAGIIDEVVPAAGLLDAARAWLLAQAGKPVRQPWDAPGFVPPGGGPDDPALHRHFVATGAGVQAAARGNLPAGAAILSCVFEGIRLPIDTGLAIELREFVSLLRGDVAQNLIRTEFFSMNEARRLAARPADVPRFAPRRIGVLGAGTMGGGLAQVAALAGLEVVLLDRDTAAAEVGRARQGAAMAKLAATGRLRPGEDAAALSRITATGDYAALAGCEAVIEAVFEDRAAKEGATRAALAATGPGVLFGSNTSKIPITGLAAASPRPDRFIGLHFFSPVPRMALVEIIRGRETSDETLAQALDLGRILGKTPIVVNDGPGFFTSRCVGRFTNEGIALLAEGVPAALIENVARQAGMPMGPLQLADSIGIDLMHAVRVQERADFGEAWKAGPEFDVIARFATEHRRHGRKTGGGFYDYPEGGAPRLWSALRGMERPDARRDPALIRRRLLHAQALEAARAMAEGIVEDPRWADIGSVLGWGFARHTGGVISYIDTLGAARFVAEADALAVRHGPRFAPPEALRVMAAEGRSYHKEPAPPVLAAVA